MSQLEPVRELKNVTALTKANVYFDGKVVSHTLLLEEGAKVTLGLIFPGSYRFTTGAAENMVIVAGACEYRLEGVEQWTACAAGASFDVPANAAFEIRCEAICEYLCAFLN